MSDAAANNPGTPGSDSQEHRNSMLAGPQKIALTVGVVASIVFLLLAGIYVSTAPADTENEKGMAQPFLSYLTGFMFWMLVGFGSVFFLMIQYVTGGRWGILLRRALEANSKTLVFGFVLFIPVVIGMFMGEKSMYWWARPGEHHEAPTPKVAERNKLRESNFDNIHPNTEVDEEKKKEEWLSPAFTAVRGFIYIGVFVGLALFMWKNARKAEYDDNLDKAREARGKQKYVSSFGLFLFAAFMTWIATDWVMSLEPTFASSMFPVIMFDNAAVASYCVGLLVLLYLKKKGDPRFANLFPATEQIHLGSLLLAFTLAWTYFNFSQYMLIWIGNLPEEIPYYLKRTNGGWGWYAGLAVIFHFPIPFLLLLFRRVKSNPVALKWIAIGLLIVIFFDVMWWITPSMSHAEAPKFYLLMDVAAWLGIGGFWMYVFFGQLKKHALLPTREVYLLEAYHHGH